MECNDNNSEPRVGEREQIKVGNKIKRKQKKLRTWLYCRTHDGETCEASSETCLIHFVSKFHSRAPFLELNPRHIVFVVHRIGKMDVLCLQHGPASFAFNEKCPPHYLASALAA